MNENEYIIDSELDTKGVEKGASKIGSVMDRLAKKMDDVAKKQKNAFENTSIPTKEYEDLINEFSRIEKQMERVGKAQDKFLATGGKTSSKTYQRQEYDLEQLGNELDTVISKMNDMETAGTAFETSEIQKYSEKTRSASKSVGLLHFANEKLKKGFSGLKKGISKLNNVFSGLFKGLKKSNKGFGSGIKNILKYALGIRSLFVLVNKLRSALVEGFKNLAQFNNGVNPTNTAISNLQSALTQLKNSFATAFAPILQVIEPILTRFISLINQAVTAFGMLIATLTGKSTFTRATKVQSDYAKSLDKSAGSAKKLKSQLLGIDELNVLNSNDDSSGGAGTDPNSMFENVDIPDKFKNIAQWLKDMWKNADFTELGAILGQKLKEALDSINWKSIQNTARKIGKSIATLINGFVESNELGLSIGKTIGEAFNTAIYFLQSFVQNLHWDSVGNFIAEAINGFFSTIDWSALGNTLSTGIKGLLDGTIELVKNTDFDAIFKAIGDFLKGFDTSEILESLSELVGEILGELVSLLVKGILDIGNSMHDYFEPFIESAKEEGKSVASGILEGIGELFKDIGTWLKENIFDPFVDGFKALFKIESPSKVMEEQGEYIILGLKNGIKNHIDDIIQAISDLKNKILDKFEEIKEKITEKFDIIKKNVNEKLDNINENADKKLKTLKESWSSAWDSMRSKVEDVVSSIKEKFGGLFDDLEDRLDRTSKSMTGGLSNIASGVAGVTPSLSTQSIPHLAKGTVIPRASSQFLAVLGDNSRESEVVSPISTMKQAFLEALEESGNQNVTVNVSLEGDAKDFFRVMRNNAYQFTKKTGKPAFEF